MRRLRMGMGGYTGTLLTVLAPRVADEAAPQVTQLECCAPGIAVRVAWGDSTDTIVFAPLNRFCQTDELVGAGRLAAVRECDGRVAGCLLSEGYELTWRGQTLVAPRARCGEVITP